MLMTNTKLDAETVVQLVLIIVSALIKDGHIISDQRDGIHHANDNVRKSDGGSDLINFPWMSDNGWNFAANGMIMITSLVLIVVSTTMLVVVMMVLVEVEIEIVMVMLMKMDITMLQAMTMRGKANNDDNVPVFWPGN